MTDLSGVPTAGIGLPVLYFRKGIVGAYSPSQCVFVSGAAYDCTFDYSLVGGVVTGDTIQYFVAAQDNVGNVSVTPSAGAGGFTANPPAAATPPTSPNSYLISAAVSGTKTLCASGCDYTTLTAAGGLFSALNAGVATGNIVVEIGSDLVAGEDGAVALNPLAEELAGSNYTVTIYPTGAPRAITSTAAPTGGFIRLNGADRVTIDGSIGGAGTDRSLPITVRSSQALPLRRITPSDRALLPSIGSGTTVAVRISGSHWHFVGLAFRSTQYGQGNIIEVNGDATDVVFDRLLIEGGSTGQRRGIALNGRGQTVTRSYIRNIWRTGDESQAIAGWTGPGPITITDNYLEAAGENVLFGGADAASVDRMPSDILVEGNFMTKNLAWKGVPNTYNVKNLFELKVARRVTVRNNRFEHNWVDAQAQQVAELMRVQEALLVQASTDGAYLTDVYMLTRTRKGRATAETLLRQAFHGSEKVVTAFRTRQLNGAEQEYIRQHALAFTPSTRIETIPGVLEAYKDTTFLPPESVIGVAWSRFHSNGRSPPTPRFRKQPSRMPRAL